MDCFEFEDETIQNVIAKHRDEFLNANGGRSIKYPLIFQMNGLSLYLKGKFKVLPRKLPQKRPTFIFQGIVDGMLKSDRKLFLIDKEDVKGMLLLRVQIKKTLQYIKPSQTLGGLCNL